MTETRKCMICGAELDAQESYCGSCGAKAPGGAESKEEVELNHLSKGTPTSRDFGMKWHWWLTRITLLSSAVLAFIRGLLLIIGIGDEGYSRGLLIFIGIVEIGFAIFALVVRKLLKDFRESGPGCLYLYILAQMFAPLIILLITGLIEYATFGDIVGDMISNLIFLIINIVYYSKRMALFEY